MLEYRSVADMNRLIVQNLWRFSEFDLIVGIPRSGMLPATLLALYLNVPLTDLDSYVRNESTSSGWRMEQRRKDLPESAGPRNVLIIDDSVGGGRAMSIARDKIRKMPELHDRVSYAAICIRPDKRQPVDIWLEELPCRVFEWNIMNHQYLEQACVDIDGVLCRDPTSEENDDGARYSHFISEARPLYRPTFKIGWLVTCRLEKYRAPTETWLKKHGIPYNHLLMLDLPSKEERLKKDCHAAFKADMYRKTKAMLFIESNFQQAVDIARLSHKPVFCYETRQMLYHGTVDKLKKQEAVRKAPRQFIGWATRPMRKAFRNALNKQMQAFRDFSRKATKP